MSFCLPFLRILTDFRSLNNAEYNFKMQGPVTDFLY